MTSMTPKRPPGGGGKPRVPVKPRPPGFGDNPRGPRGVGPNDAFPVKPGGIKGGPRPIKTSTPPAPPPGGGGNPRGPRGFGPTDGPIRPKGGPRPPKGGMKGY